MAKLTISRSGFLPENIPKKGIDIESLSVASSGLIASLIKGRMYSWQNTQKKISIC